MKDSWFDEMNFLFNDEKFSRDESDWVLTISMWKICGSLIEEIHSTFNGEDESHEVNWFGVVIDKELIEFNIMESKMIWFCKVLKTFMIGLIGLIDLFGLIVSLGIESSYPSKGINAKVIEKSMYI